MYVSVDFLKTIYENLRLKSKILAFVIGCVALMQVIGIAIVYNKGIFQKYQATSLVFIGPCLIIFACLSEVYVYRFFNRRIKELKPISKVIIYGITTIEVSFPTIIIAFVLVLQGGITGVTGGLIMSSPPFIMYFIMIGLSSLVMNWRLCFYGGAMAGIQYFLLCLVMIKKGMLTDLDIPNSMIRGVFLLAFGIIMGFISRKILESVRSSLDSKNKLINELDAMVKEKTKEIRAQKEELAEKNKDITDSINYAKNIQDSILPDITEIRKQWNDLFVFYQPKDIVSGDFYWFYKISAQEFLIACCDCTGHGVPGAFMSMLCSSKLHEAVAQSTEPDKILFYANNRIKENLGQKLNEKNKDGMEICLIKVNTAKKEIHYAGANRPLWIFEHRTKVLREIKPTKASIASSTPFDFKYDLQVIKLEKEDIIYATSDGYCDQFGGKADKKYMAKNFKTFLSKKAALSMEQQHEEIRTNINDWMGKREQVDDLLVIGVKL